MRLGFTQARLAAALVLAIVAAVSGCAASASTSASQSPSVREGSPLQEPQQLVSHNGFLQVRLVVERRRVQVADRTLWALTYNGRYMPPTLRIRPGDRVELAMENRLGQYTNLHVHGLHVSPSGNSDNIFSFAPTVDLSRAAVAARRTLVFSENSAGTRFFINGKQFDMNRVDFRSKLNTVEEWTVRNDSNEEHSFHVHVNHFQLMSINGKPHQGHGLQDTASVPAKGQFVIRIRFNTFVGKTVLHCHILNHEDAGMMAVLEIVK
ncbi:multicopper oxidase domain-containing protein [Streptomyces sp. RB6PN25]|uniref:Multicopper oxidase domain-containing protein n=1 Tax=Streptomyces humicola TaxID=2953240 RepID=A0ABT1PYR2_9ACTN|nr:multicopper oxidase domain-containing protein [Streptomyces humicola]MCQ4082802.1 multicopper oxidase domain-containing protein [Streptomyces humicola]